MKIGFDLISDIDLKPGDQFSWEGKATSLYCIIAGNISSDTGIISMVLGTLSKMYQGVFYIGGSLEYAGAINPHKKAIELNRICRKFRNLAFLHHNVIILDGIAILGANGWYGNFEIDISTDLIDQEIYKLEDIAYLKTSIEKLQKHIDVKKIILVTNAVPAEELYFGETPEEMVNQIPMTTCLTSDLEKKVSHWCFGSHKKTVDTAINNINYFNNPRLKDSPYWAKRIEIDI